MRPSLVLTLLTAFLTAMFLSGCGGGGATGPGSQTTPTPIVPVQTFVAISGNVVKGPVVDADIAIYEVRPEGESLIGSAKTLNEGAFSLQIPTPQYPIRIRARGGTYLDEATGQPLSLNTTLQALVPGAAGATPLAVTPLTHLAATMVSAASASQSSAVSFSQAAVAALFGMTSIRDLSGSYRAVLAGVSELANRLGTDPLAITEVMASDLQDGKLDGLTGVTPMIVGTRQISSDYATRELAESVQAFVVSTRNTSGLTVSQTVIQAIKASDGQLTSSVRMTLEPLPERSNLRNMTIRGNTQPGAAVVTAKVNGVTQLTLVSAADGQFALPIQLPENQISTIEIAAVRNGVETRQTLVLAHDSTPPSLVLSPTFPAYTNQNSLAFSLRLTDSQAKAFIVSAQVSSGTLTFTSQILQLSGFSSGRVNLDMEISDGLNSQKLGFITLADFTAPVLSLSPPAYVSGTLKLNLNANESLNELRYRLFPVSSPTLGATEVIDPVLNLVLPPVQGLWYFDVSGQDFAGNPLQCPSFLLPNCTANFVFDSIAPSFQTSPLVPSLIQNLDQLRFNFSPLENVFLSASLSMNSQGVSTSRSISAGSNCEVLPVSVSPGPACALYLPALSNPADGTLSLTILMTDPAGNLSSFQRQIQLDQTAPAPPQASSVSAITSALHQNITVQGEVGTQLLLGTQTLNSQFLGTLTTSLPLVANATTTFQFRLRDAAGNLSAESYLAIAQDGLPPQGTYGVSHPPRSWLTAADQMGLFFRTVLPEPGAQITASLLGSTYSLLSTDQQHFFALVSLNSMTLATNSVEIQFTAQDFLRNSTQTTLLTTFGVDTRAPAILSASVSHPTTFARFGQSIRSSLVLSAPDLATNVTGRRINSSGSPLSAPLSFQSTDQMNWFHDYLVTSNDLDNGAIPFRMQLDISDAATNRISTVLASSIFIDSTSPTVALISNNRLSPVTLGLGQDIEFTVSLFSADPQLVISGTYSSLPLSFVPFAAGAYWRATTQISEALSVYPADLVTPQAQLQISDLAGNPAVLPQTNQILKSLARYDNRRPSISGVQVGYSTNAQILTQNDSVQLLATLDPLAEPPGSMPITSVLVTFASSSLPLLPSGTMAYSVTIPVQGNFGTSFTPTDFSVVAIDGAGNHSTAYTSVITRVVDTRISVPLSIQATSVSTRPVWILSDSIQLQMLFGPDSDLKRATARLEPASPPLDLIFVPGAEQGKLTTFFSLPAWNLQTSVLTLNSIVVERNSGNLSPPVSLSFSAVIDTLAPSIASITALPSKTPALGIGDSITYQIVAQGLETGLSVSMNLFGTSLPWQSAQTGTYLTTFTIAEGMVATTGQLPATAVYLIDGNLNQSQAFFSPLSPAVTIDSTRPVLQSISVTTLNPNTLVGLGTQLVFSLQAATQSTDVTSAQGFFNGVTLSFGPTLQSTYTVLSTHSNATDAAPQLTGLRLVDAAGNQSLTTATTSLPYRIDTTVPAFVFTGQTPSLVTTIGILGSLSLVADISSAEAGVIVTGIFNSQPLTLTSLDGIRYSTSYIVQATHPHSPAFQQLQLFIRDLAGNQNSLITTSLTVGIDTIRPVIQTIVTTSTSSSAQPTLLKTFDVASLSVTMSPNNTSLGSDPVNRVEASYLGRPVSLNSTDGGFIWRGFYSIQPEDPSSDTPAQFTSILAYDSAGNTNVASATTDFSKGILARLPRIDSVLHAAAGTKLSSGTSVVFTIIPDSVSVADSTTVTASFNTAAVVFSRSVTGSYIGTYIHSGAFPDSPSTAPQLQARLLDRVGNIGPLYTTTNLPYLLKALPPTLTLSHSALSTGVIGIYADNPVTSNQIQFDLQIAPADENAVVLAAYNDVSPNLGFFAQTSPDPGYSLKRAVYQATPASNSTTTPLQVTVTVTDSFGNQASISTTSINKSIDVSRPILSSLTLSYSQTGLTSSFIGLTNSLTFSLTASAVCFDLSCIQDAPISLQAVYNSVPLSFVSTDRVHWTTSYIPREGDPSANVPVPGLTSISARDTAGNRATSITSTASVTKTIDPTPPQILALSVRSNSPVSVLTVGNFIEFVLTASPKSGTGTSVEESGYATASYNHALLTFLQEGSGGTYVSTYTVATTHAEQNVPLQLQNVIFYDRALNQSSNTAATIQAMQGVTLPINLFPPVALTLSTTTSTQSTWLKVGDSVGFTLQLSRAEAGLGFSSPSYNGVSLTFTSTDSGLSFRSTYTIDTGHNDQSSPLQLTLTAVDAGMLTTTLSTSDVFFRIDANPPAIQTVNFLNPGAESIGVGGRLTFVLQSATTETAAQVIQYSMGSVTPITLLGTTLVFSSVNGLTFTTHIDILAGSDEEGFFSLQNLSLRDQAGNTSPLRSTSTVFKAIDRTIPQPVSLTPSYWITNAVSATISVSGQASTSTFLNGNFLATSNSGGGLSYTTNLIWEQASILEFFLREPSLNQSAVSTAKALLTSMSSQQNYTNTGLPVSSLQVSYLHHLNPAPPEVLMRTRSGWWHASVTASLNLSSAGNGLPNTDLLSFAQHPLVTNLFLAAMADGLYRSTDGGYNFHKLPSSSHHGKLVKAVAFDPSQSSRAYIGTTLYLYRSEDQGLTFPHNMNDNGPVPLTPEKGSIRALEALNNRLYVASNAGLFFCDMTGSFGSWNLSAGSAIPTTATTDITRLFASTQNTNLLAWQKEDGSVFLTSTLSTETETSKPSFSQITVTSPIRHLSILSDGNLVLTGQNALYSSANQGASWPSSLTMTGESVLSFSARTLTQAAFVGSVDGLYLVTQVFSTQPQSAKHLFPAQVKGLLPLGASSSILYFTSSSADILNLQTMSSTRILNSTSPILCADWKSSNQRVYFGLQNGLFSMTESGAATLAHALPVTAVETPVISLHFSSSINNLVLAGTRGLGLFRSQDSGLTFTTATPGLGITTVIALTTLGTDVYAVTPAGIYRSVDEGQNFVLKVANTSVTSISATSTLTPMLYVVASGIGYQLLPNDTVLTGVTTNLSQTITNLSALDGITRRLIAATTNGVFTSDNNGSTWAEVPHNRKVIHHSVLPYSRTSQVIDVYSASDAGLLWHRTLRP